MTRAEELPFDYLDFGPTHPTATKGYERGLGPEAAWIAARASTHPPFPIGGIDAILCAADPREAARELAELLAPAE